MYQGKRALMIVISLYFVLIMIFLIAALFGDAGLLSIHSLTDALVFWQYHLAVLVASSLIGAALGVAGSVLQVLLKNPLADASVLGISSGSQFFGVLLLLFMPYFAMSGNYTFAWFFLACLIGAIIVLGLFLIVIALQRMLSNIAVIILLGVGISAIFGALTTLLISFSDSQLFQQVVIWQFGGVSTVSWGQNILIALIFIIFFTFVLRKANVFDMFALGEHEARLMGVNIKGFFTWVMIFLSLMVAATVAVAGPIAFVGLVAPHIARMLLGTNKTLYVAISSAASGALILLIAQIVAMNLFYPIVIPVGILTAIIGAPFLIVLVIRSLSVSMES